MGYRTALIGCGAISAKHLKGIEQNRNDLELVAVLDVDRGRAERLAAALGVPAFTDPETLAAATDPEIVGIATPSHVHADDAAFWMEHGAHVLLEKPVALGTAEIDRLLRVQRATQRRVAVGYVLRYAPHVELVERAVREGRFGRILHVGLAIYWNRGDAYFTDAPWRGTWTHDGGLLMNQATHGIDLVQMVLGGPPETVAGVVSRQLRPVEADDLSVLTLTYASGAVATVVATVCTYPENLGTRLTILGERGTVELAGNGPDRIVTWRFPDDPGWASVDAAIASGETPGADLGATPRGHGAVYADLVASIRDGREPRTSLADAAISAQIVLAALKSHHDDSRTTFPFSFATRDMAPRPRAKEI